jgi:phage repressor protein C with HTH and peptisase S24 domain
MYDLEQKSISLRFKELREKLNLNQGEFSDSIGINRHVITKIEIGAQGISYDTLRSVINYHNVNPLWLYTGIGDMFISDGLLEIINYASHKPNVTLYEISASAGGLIAAQQDSEVVSQWFIPDLNGEHIAINVTGNSMSPSIEHKDKIIAKECFRNDLRDGQIYIIVTTDNNVRVKRLRMGNEVLMLWSDNIAFQPRFEKLIPDEIVRIFHVVMVCKNLAY